MQTETVIFRASPDFVATLASTASEAGLSKSEAIRRAVQEKATSKTSEPPPINIAPSAQAERPAAPPSLHEGAARGDAESFSQLAGLHYQSGNDTVPLIIAYARAADYARLAAMARGTRQDWLNFLFILDQHAAGLREAGLEQLADPALGETVALAEYMGEDGDEEIAAMVVKSADALSAGSLSTAQGLRSIVKEQIGC